MGVAAVSTVVFAILVLTTMSSESIRNPILRLMYFLKHLPGQQLSIRGAWAASALLGRDPILPWSIALTANQRDERPLANWQYRRLPFRAHVRICQRATGTSVQTTLYSGAETIQQRGPEQAGGTAGTTPVHFTTPLKEWIGAQGDELIVSNDETGGLTPTVDGIIYVDPI